ncbi:hypothetical protein [Candidatus Laterigemmans baculatus]|uniref:hypothetical protein n=1 Tax=Candidatus Laterigemmans baculatus TaxID=2770505 RepID=UPI0013D8EC66|nr:hypothetical protein [Candidatus Laterigemmans baculatus]
MIGHQSTQPRGLRWATAPLLALLICNRPSVAESQDKTPAVRQYDSAAIAVPAGYTIEPVATKLDFPVDITFGNKGEIYLALAGGHTYGTGPKMAPPAKIIQLMPDGSTKVVFDKMVPMQEIKKADSSDKMSEGLIPPVTGVTWHEGKLYISHRFRYSVLDPKTGDFKTIVNGLPSWGEFLNGKPIFDDQGRMVFFLSTQGNSGVLEEHWMKVINTFNKPAAHEIPGEDIELTGQNFPVPVEDPSTPNVRDTKMTGAFMPLGQTAKRGKMVGGKKICNGAFFRCRTDGSELERIAWGFRSSFGYRFAPDGRLICTQNSANPMPPRGLWWDHETVYEVVQGEWYGWPDFFSGIPITDPRFEVHKGKNEFVLTAQTHRRLLKGQPLPRQPLVRLSPHSAAEGMVFGRRDFGLSENSILVAEMGAIVPMFKGKGVGPGKAAPSDPPPDVDFDWPGFRVQLIDLDSRRVSDFVINRSRRPASAAEPDQPGPAGGLERPVQLEWGPDGALYIVDFGVIHFEPKGMNAHARTGAVWRVTRATQ